MSETQVALVCLVYGDPNAEPFEVKIARKETIGVLKGVIKQKQKPAFDHLPADHLRLWKVQIPITDEETPHIPELNNKLGPAMEICRVFPAGPPKDHIHIIVKVPCKFCFFNHSNFGSHRGFSILNSTMHWC
jgi:hypothetical protein